MNARRHVGTLLGVLCVGLGVLVASGTSARAQPADPCLGAPVDGQKLRNAGKLLDARDQFAICSHKTCPTEIVQSCMRWGAELHGAIPSVVVAARDAHGQDLVDVHVSIDDSPRSTSARAPSSSIRGAIGSSSCGCGTDRQVSKTTEAAHRGTHPGNRSVPVVDSSTGAEVWTTSAGEWGAGGVDRSRSVLGSSA